MQNTVSNQQLAKAFTEAKKLLWNGKGVSSKHIEMICSALYKANIKKKITNVEMVAARNIVMDRLYPAIGMYGFLYRNDVPREDMTALRVQTHRHQWLDMLIEEFSK